jgi:RimJ/RimL family protein N-acetyltransferase
VNPFAPDFPLLTERLLLRPFAPEDFAALYALRSGAETMRWLYQEPVTEEEARAMLELRLPMVAIAAEGDSLGLVLESRETGAYLGDCNLTLVSEQHRLGEIGFVLHPDHQGHGYATEAARELLRIAFVELRLHRVIGRTEARNAASARVLERLGMRREAHLVENEWVKREWQSELVYALLEQEYP